MQLSKTETVVMQLLSDGKTREEVSEYRCRSIETVKTQIKSIFFKLGAKNTAHAVKIAMQQHLIKSLSFTFGCLFYGSLFF